MTKEIRETLEGLKKRVEINKTLSTYMWSDEKKDKLKIIEVLSTAIGWGEELQSAKKRIKLIEQANRAANKIIEEEINLKTEALLRIEELEEIIKDKDHFADDLIETAGDVEKELQSAKEKIKESKRQLDEATAFAMRKGRRFDKLNTVKNLEKERLFNELQSLKKSIDKSIKK